MTLFGSAGLLFLYLSMFTSAAMARDWTPRFDSLHQDVSSVSSALSDHVWTLDTFELAWQQGQGGPTLAVRDAASQRVLWATRPGRAFVMAASAQESILQWRGSFTLKDRVQKARCRTQTVDTIEMETDQQTLNIEGSLTGPSCSVRYRLSFAPRTDKRLAFHVELLAEAPDSQKLNRLFLNFASRSEEQFFGFGEQYTYFDLKGRTVPILSTEQGHLRGRQPYTFFLNRISPGAAGAWYTTYASVPFYMTSDQHAFYLKTSEFSAFDLEDRDQVEVRIWARQMEGEILKGERPLDLIETYTEYAGRLPKPPQWFHRGAIVGIMGGSERVRELWQKLKEQGTPIAAFWLQDWQGKRVTSLGIRMWWNWELDREVYPDWERLVGDFAEEGIRTLGYVNPFLSDVSSKATAKVNLFAEAKAKGYLIRKANGEPYEIDSGGFTGSLVDLSNPEAFAWYRDVLIRQMVGIGLKGWMADFGEAVPFDAQMQAGAAPVLHNRYPELWARLNREVLEKAQLEGEGLIFLRSGFTKSPGMAPMFWLGDQMTTWDEYDGLKSAITGLLSGGLSGFSINHADIGGLIAMKRQVLGVPIVNFQRSKELLLRGIEMSAFTSAYRNHEGNDPTHSHQIASDAETLAFYAYFAKVFALLADYRDTVFQEAHDRGYPVARHLFLHYPKDPNVSTAPYQWLLGSDFLIAPVVDPGQQEKALYLPEGQWVHVWSGREYVVSSQGLRVTVPAPLGQPPVFYKKGSAAGEEFQRRLKALPRAAWLPR